MLKSDYHHTQVFNPKYNHPVGVKEDGKDDWKY